MALLAWKAKNSGNYGVTDVKTIGQMLLDITGVALSDPNLSWVPTPNNRIYHIGYQAATDNVGNGAVYQGTAIGYNETTYQLSASNMQSEPWWGSQTTAETWAAAYYDNGGGLGPFNKRVLFAYSYSQGENIVFCVYKDANGISLYQETGNSRAPFAETRGDYAVTYQMTRAGGGGAGVQFWGTQYKNDVELVILANYVVKLLNLEGVFGKEFPFKEGQQVEDNLLSNGLYVNRGGGIVVTVLDGSTFGEPEMSSINITIGTNDNGSDYSERQFTGNWTIDERGIGHCNLTSIDNYIMDGSIDVGMSSFNLDISMPGHEHLITSISGTIDENYAIVTWSVSAVYGI